MAAALKVKKIERDRFTDDGVRLFNASKPHGVVYADGYFETKYIQEYEGREVHYKGDGAPVGYQHGVPMPPSADELIEENTVLNARIRDLEDSQKRTNELLERLMKQLEGKAAGEALPQGAKPAATYAAGDRPVEAQARGAQKTK